MSVLTDIKADDPMFLPKYATDGSANVDLVANVPPDTTGRKIATIPPGRCAMIDCGITLGVPKGFKVCISARSGHAKAMMIVPNAPGQIDQDFTGRIMVLIANVGKNIMAVEHGERFAQMWIEPAWRFKWNEVKEFPETGRGAGGFGSTGKGVK
jgi:dUTP pyrophosphatase